MSKKIIILGFGFLGKNLVKTINESNLGITIVGISEIHGFIYDKEGISVNAGRFEGHPRFRKGDSRELIKIADADMMVELTPTNATTGEPALTHIKLALEKGMDVVTSNKGPFVTHFREIMDLAKRKGKTVRYGATVGGATPSIIMVRDALRGDEIKSVYGILNGTTNYILSTMYHEARPFDNVLKEAQELGYAEADPTYDIDGIDAAGKLVILVNTIFGLDRKVGDVKITGVRKITQEAMKLAMESGMTIKLICYADRNRMEVCPMLVPIYHPLNVEGTLNAFFIKTRLHGELTLVGRGAGKETVGAILNDILSV